VLEQQLPHHEQKTDFPVFNMVVQTTKYFYTTNFARFTKAVNEIGLFCLNKLGKTFQCAWQTISS
jgi:formate-dependent phosphoribosylglycinamide formyltransferase (GAR transformylase)